MARIHKELYKKDLHNPDNHNGVITHLEPDILECDSSCDSLSGLCRVQSSKSRILMCLIGKTQFLCMQCRRFGPHLVARGMSHGFSRVAAGTWGTFSSYDGDAHSKPEFV